MAILLQQTFRCLYLSVCLLIRALVCTRQQHGITGEDTVVHFHGKDEPDHGTWRKTYLRPVLPADLPILSAHANDITFLTEFNFFGLQ
jgi:hypothetical protein